MAFSFLEYLLSFQSYCFVLCKWGKWSCHKTVKHWIKNISRSIGAVLLGIRNVQHKRNRIVPLPWKHSWLQSRFVKKQISPFATLSSGTEGPAWIAGGVHIILTLLIRLLWPLNGTSSKTVAMAMAQGMSFCFFCDVHFWCHVFRTVLLIFLGIFFIHSLVCFVTCFLTHCTFLLSYFVVIIILYNTHSVQSSNLAPVVRKWITLSTP